MLKIINEICDSLESFNIDAGNIESETRQLSKGKFSGSNQLVFTEDLLLFNRKVGQVVTESGRISDDIILVPLSNNGPNAQIMGKEVDKNTQVIFYGTLEKNNIYPAGYNSCGIALRKSALNKYYDDDELDCFESYCRHSLFSVTDPRKKMSLAHRCESIIKRIIHDSTVAGGSLADSHGFLKELCSDFYHDFFDYLHKPYLPVLSVSFKSRVVRRALDFLFSHPTGLVTVTELAKASCTSVRNLQICLKSKLGVSPKQLINRYRFNQIRRALLLDRRSLAEVIKQYGINNVSRFRSEYQRLFEQGLPFQ